MRDKVLKWWYRKWSNWSHYDYVYVYGHDRLINKDHILKRTSNDGLIEYKQVKTI